MISTGHDTVLEQLTRILVDRFAPERIILFGSRGRGDHRQDSDYDLVIVMERPPKPGSLVNPVYDAIREVHSEVDFRIDTPERFVRRCNDVGTIEYVAHREGRVVYERETISRKDRVREEKRGQPDSLAEWLLRARNDFTAMEALLLGAPDALDTIAFHAHQASEKLLKAALVARRLAPPRTHMLEQILRLASSELRDDPGLRAACTELDRLWSSTRYPDDPIPTPEQVARAVECATRIRATVRVAAMA